jgi:predicted porin
MNKKLLVIAVAGALAAPGVALAQSTVTISGKFSVSADQVSYSRATAANTVANTTSRLGNQSETRVSDNSSRMIFNVREDLGNGLAAVAQLDMRFNPATAAAPTGTAYPAITGSGNTWVGLDSKTYGRLTMGRHDLHYGKSGDSWNAAGAGHLQSWGSALFDSIGKPSAATATAAKGSGAHSSLASQSRTNQVIRWDSPNWQGFDATIAYSANPLTAGGGNASTGGDLGVGLPGAGPNVGQVITRKGQGWNINPRYTASNWNVEYSYWNAKGDINSAGVSVGNATCINAATGCISTAGSAGSATNLVTGIPVVTSGQGLIQDDQRSDVLAGGINWMGWRFGLAWNRSKTTSVATGLVTGDRSAWSLPISYTSGPHMFGFVYVKANDSKDIVTPAATAGGNGYIALLAGQTISGADSGAKMWTLNYQYNLSKRTAVGLTWSQIVNSAAANYNFFYNSPTAFGSANTGTLPGEKVQLVGANIRHNF